LEKIFYIDTDSLFAILFWGSVIALVFLVIYRGKNKFTEQKRVLTLLIIARICHIFYYFLVSGRGILPDWLSVNLGCSALLAGFYFEAKGILRIIRENTLFTAKLLNTILLVFVVLFNTIEFMAPLAWLRVATVSLSVVAIMAMPVLRMLVSRDAGVYTKPVGGLYVIFLLLLVMRIWHSLYYQSMGVLTTSILQSVTFLSSLLQLMVALPSYTVIIKDYADEALMLMATTDKLTGATNRHAFMDASAAVCRSGRNTRVPLSVLFIDIDHFKQINDRYGHAFGDAVLVRMAELIDKCLRGSDLSCRYGGEEFIVMLPRTVGSAAHAVAERIMNEVRAARFEEQPDFSFTVSIGISSADPSSKQSFDDIISSADAAMYRAKRAGRDRIIVSWESVEANLATA
jgi:diguanylate cyclase (GGDEF)-like protein